MPAPHAFLPVLTFRYSLDQALLPLLPHIAQAALLSLPELREYDPQRHRFPELPLMVDSGGYAALSPHSRVIESGGLGVLIRPGGHRFTPADVHAAQQQYATWGCTLDFPSPDALGEAERQRRHALSLANARWAFSQPRDFQLFACLQPGQDVAPLLELSPDGIALGGLVPFARDAAFLAEQVRAVRAQIGELPLHVFGIGNPQGVRAVMRAGASSVDSSGPQRAAVEGKSYAGHRLNHPSATERLMLAALNLSLSAQAAGGELPPAPPWDALTRHASSFAQAQGWHARPEGLLLTWPTGSGKTSFARQCVAMSGGKTIVLVPLKALAAEVAADWSRQFPDKHVAAYTRDQKGGRTYAGADILIMTPERLELLCRSRRQHGWLSTVTLVVADELHLIGDPSRGARLDSVLTRLKLLSPLARIVAMTATCGNPDEIAAWLGLTHLPAHTRPAELDWNVVDLPQKRGVSKLDFLRPHLREEQTLVFVHSRTRASELARELGGEAHHAGLGTAQRADVEARFRSGEVRTLVCTPTMEVGVNLGADHVVLHDLSRFEQGRWAAISANTLHQRAGRAGRTPGKRGRVTLLRQGESLGPESPVEALLSPLRERAALQEFLLGCVDAGAQTREQLSRWLSLTLAATQGELAAAQEVDTLLRLEALEEGEGGRLRITHLGRVASQSLLSVQTVRAEGQLPDDPTAFDVLLRSARASALSVRLSDRALDVLSDLVPMMASRVMDADDYEQADLITALVLWSACVNGEEDTALALELYPPDVRSLREAALRTVEAWHLYRPGLKLQLVRIMLAAQLDLEASTLALLPGIGPALAKRLAAQGVCDLEVLAQSEAEDLCGPGLSGARASALIAAAQDKVKTFDTDPCREVGARAWTLTPEPDPVRLARARHLSVTPCEGGGFTVTGGAEPHHVTAEGHCDCADRRHLALCKHVLAVRLRGEAQKKERRTA